MECVTSFTLSTVFPVLTGTHPVIVNKSRNTSTTATHFFNLQNPPKDDIPLYERGFAKSERQ